MADIASSIVKINDVEVSADAPVSEALFNKIGGTVNGLVDLTYSQFSNSQTFTSSGTFNVPANVTTVFVRGWGAGGSGGGGSAAPGAANPFGGTGGCGGTHYSTFVNVTAGGTVSVTIGTGGTGVGIGLNGTGGGSSAFGSLSFKGGYGGFNPPYQVISGTLVLPFLYPPATSQGGPSGGWTGGDGLPGLGAGSAGIALPTGGGGGGSYGAGGAGGAKNAAGTNAAANTGGGGGGSGGYDAGAGAYQSGNGGSGRVIVYWST